MTRVRIGICAAIEPIAVGVYKTVAHFVPDTYVSALERGGAEPVIFTSSPTIERDPGSVLSAVDGLLVMGGADIDPSLYGAERHPMTGPPMERRDRSELALTKHALSTGVPVLGICRGFQMMNIACGGTLIQHLDNAHEHAGPKGAAFLQHEVRLEPGSMAATCAGAELTTVMSEHHQAVERLGEGLVVTGYSVHDDLIEAFEYAGHPLALGVQWHPEHDEKSQVVSGFVREVAARSRAALV